MTDRALCRFTRPVLVCSVLALAMTPHARTAASQSKPDFLAANIDPVVSPRDDFFQYATGSWLKRNPIPADRARWTAGNLVSEELDARIRRASEKAAASRAPRGSNAQLVGDFWATGMDIEARNRAGLSALQGDLDRIAGIENVAQLIDVVAVLHQRNMLLDSYVGFVGSRTLFSMRVERDEQNRTRRVLNLSQGGITLGAPAVAPCRLDAEVLARASNRPAAGR